MGIEPTNKGFADLCLTTWLPRRARRDSPEAKAHYTTLKVIGKASKQFPVSASTYRVSTSPAFDTLNVMASSPTMPLPFSTLIPRRLSGILLGLLLVAGCAQAPPRQTFDPSIDHLPRAPAPPVLHLMTTPRDMREDYSHPPDLVYRAVRWDETGPKWTFRFPPRRYAYTGFVFFYSRNLRDYREQTDLVFDLAPAFMARHLWVGLIDGIDEPDRVMVERPVVHPSAPNPSGQKAMTFRIPLTDFSSQGVAVHRGEASLEDTRELTQPFNWYDVREIRFTSPGGRIPGRDIEITNLRFERPARTR